MLHACRQLLDVPLSTITDLKGGPKQVTTLKLVSPGPTTLAHTTGMKYNSPNQENSLRVRRQGPRRRSGLVAVSGNGQG